MNEFLPIILGSDLNTYSIAREIHEAYGIKSTVATSMILAPCLNSQIIDFYKRDNFSKDEDIFCKTLNEIYADNKDKYKEFIIFSPDDNFRNIAIRNRERLDFEVHLPYANLNKIDELLTKNSFYEKIAKLDLAPKTLLVNKENYKDQDYPEDVYIKANNDILYKKDRFDGWQKGYHSKSKDQTIKIIEKIYQNSYDDEILVQEFLKGSDGTEFNVDGYRSKDTISIAKCKNILLDKRVEWIGNYVAKIDTDEEILVDYAKKIVETLGVYGLFNIDFKKDIETGKFYAFEINLRQGRSHYYATQNGVNLSKIAIEDQIYDNQLEIIGDKAFSYYNLNLKETIDNLAINFRDEFTQEKRMANAINPLIYDKDMSFMRKIKIHKYLDRLSKETFAIKEI